MIKPSEGTQDVSSGGCKSLNLNHLLLASLGGLAAVAAAAFSGESFLRRRRTRQGVCMGDKDQKIAPLIERKDSSRRSNLERFSYYVARQLGIEDPDECPQLCKLANAYLMKTKGYNENVYEYLVNEADADSLYIHLLEEFERCILTYFAFNWTQSSNLISQILSDESDQKIPKLKDFVMAATSSGMERLLAMSPAYDPGGGVSNLNTQEALALPEKEVIQPHLPVRLPCYDFTPVILQLCVAGLFLEGGGYRSSTLPAFCDKLNRMIGLWFGFQLRCWSDTVYLLFKPCGFGPLG
ncbi:Secretoglobin protein [Raphanus sativus]|nr:Secretoglobin protein [Raphanus sativus]